MHRRSSVNHLCHTHWRRTFQSLTLLSLLSALRYSKLTVCSNPTLPAFRSATTRSCKNVLSRIGRPDRKVSNILLGSWRNTQSPISPVSSAHYSSFHSGCHLWLSDDDRGLLTYWYDRTNIVWEMAALDEARTRANVAEEQRKRAAELEKRREEIKRHSLTDDLVDWKEEFWGCLYVKTKCVGVVIEFIQFLAPYGIMAFISRRQLSLVIRGLSNWSMLGKILNSLHEVVSRCLTRYIVLRHEYHYMSLSLFIWHRENYDFALNFIVGDMGSVVKNPMIVSIARHSDALFLGFKCLLRHACSWCQCNLVTMYFQQVSKDWSSQYCLPCRCSSSSFARHGYLLRYSFSSTETERPWMRRWISASKHG